MTFNVPFVVYTVRMNLIQYCTDALLGILQLNVISLFSFPYRGFFVSMCSFVQAVSVIYE